MLIIYRYHSLQHTAFGHGSWGLWVIVSMQLYATCMHNVITCVLSHRVNGSTRHRLRVIVCDVVALDPMPQRTLDPHR